MNNVYLDAASTTKPNQEVVDVVVEYLTKKWYNPSSLYSNATKVKEDLNRAKKTVADFIGANADEIYFTSSGSESNCWALQGFVNYTRNHANKTPVIITSKIEHHSIMACLDELKHDAHVFYVDVNKDGFVNIKQLDDYLHKFDLDSYSVLVSIMHANNEIGSIQDIKMISKIVHGHNGAILHCDCTQSFGHIPIDVDYLGIDMMTASGHKISAPKGTAILYKRNGININPLIYGSQMNDMRGGTENVPYIMGFAKAVDLSYERVSNRWIIELIRDSFIDNLISIGCKLNGTYSRLPNNINVLLPEGVGGEEMLYMLDLSNIMVSTGSACNSMMKKPSYVLKAIGLTDEECARSIRITFPEDITNDDIDNVVKEIEKNIKLLSI